MPSLNHSFNTHLAAEFSIEEAIMINHFQYWIEVNQRQKKNKHKGRTWTYQTAKEICAHFGYWSKGQVENIIRKLVSKKVLKKANFNRSKFDRTTWYGFVDEEKYVNPPDVENEKPEPQSVNGIKEKISISRNQEMEELKTGNGSPKNETPIPEALKHALTESIPQTPLEGGSSLEKKRELREKEKAPTVRIYRWMQIGEKTVQGWSDRYGTESVRNAINYAHYRNGKEKIHYPKRYIEKRLKVGPQPLDAVGLEKKEYAKKIAKFSPNLQVRDYYVLDTASDRDLLFNTDMSLEAFKEIVYQWTEELV